MPVQPEFTITATIPEDADAGKNLSPNWSDLRVTVEPEAMAPTTLHLTRSAGELLIMQVGDVLHPWAGMSIREHIEAELDTRMDGLMDGSEATPEAKGTALGLALAIAYMYNPIDPNVDAVREEAMDRWAERHGDDDERAMDAADAEAEDAEEDVPFN
jgi:hypothetical protein